MATIANGANVPLFAKSGSVPDVSGAMQDYFQPMTFEPVAKSVSGFQAVEVGSPVTFRGCLQPFTDRQLLLKPEGQRAWTWFTLFADPVLTLEVDDVVIWNSKQTRVMSRKDFGLYGYVEYTACQDWTGVGP